MTKEQVIQIINKNQEYFPNIRKEFVQAIIKTESQFKLDAVGDSGKSWGLGQIYEPTRKLVASLLGMDSSSVMEKSVWFNAETAVKAVYVLNNYNLNKLKKLRFEGSEEQLARTYNGGLGVITQKDKFQKGYNQTTLYWAKVKANLVLNKVVESVPGGSNSILFFLAVFSVFLYRKLKKR